MTITVYTKPDCTQCVATKMVLDKRGIVYRTIDITEDESALDYVTTTLGYSQAPVVVVDDDTHWSGFRIEAIKAIDALTAA